MVDDVKELVSLIQMGVLEIHVWGAMPNAPDYPNRIVFDLDPRPTCHSPRSKGPRLKSAPI